MYFPARAALILFLSIFGNKKNWCPKIPSFVPRKRVASYTFQDHVLLTTPSKYLASSNKSLYTGLTIYKNSLPLKVLGRVFWVQKETKKLYLSYGEIVK